MKAFAYVNPTNEKDAIAALKAGGIVRPLGGYEMPDHLRVTVGLPEENQLFLRALEESLS